MKNVYDICSKAYVNIDAKLYKISMRNYIDEEYWLLEATNQHIQYIVWEHMFDQFYLKIN